MKDERRAWCMQRAEYELSANSTEVVPVERIHERALDICPPESPGGVRPAEWPPKLWNAIPDAEHYLRLVPEPWRDTTRTADAARRLKGRIMAKDIAIAQLPSAALLTARGDKEVQGVILAKLLAMFMLDAKAAEATDGEPPPDPGPTFPEF